MRTEQEMFGLILSYVDQDENVRVVVLNGSRANPKIPKDLFQDYDIVYFVKDIAPLVRNHAFIEYFGEIMILQLPDEMGTREPSEGECYGYLMQFMDGNRIDLRICALDHLEELVDSDSLTVVLLDKDGRVRNVPPANDHNYHVQKPSEKMFDDCCNEFWWLNPYIAKGLWRGELISSRYFLDCLLRGELMKMLEWYFGLKTGFTKSMGKQGKFLKEVLDDHEWGTLEDTYVDADFDMIWQALFLMGDLFRKIANTVAGGCGFIYPVEDDLKVTTFLQKVRDLPAGAASFEESTFLS